MKKVLIAEDSSVIQNLAKKILEFQNFEIHSVKNGQQVLDAMEKEDFDILLLDINMPVMDGMDCARAVRGLADAEKDLLYFLRLHRVKQERKFSFKISIVFNRIQLFKCFLLQKKPGDYRHSP